MSGTGMSFSKTVVPESSPPVHCSELVVSTLYAFLSEESFASIGNSVTACLLASRSSEAVSIGADLFDWFV